MSAEQVIERLIMEYGDAILRMCYLYLKDYHLAEDAAQETFIKAMKHYESFHQKSSEKTWLTRIAINCGQCSVQALHPIQADGLFSSDICFKSRILHAPPTFAVL